MLTKIVFLALLAVAATQMQTTELPDNDGSGEIEYQGEPLTFEEIREMASTFGKTFKGMTKSLKPFFNPPDVAVIQLQDIVDGLKKTNRTFAKFYQLTGAVEMAIQDAERRADIFGFQLHQPCGAALNNLMDQRNDMENFEDLVMFWEAVQLDIRCISDYTRKMKTTFKYFQNVNENSNAVDFLTEMARLRYFIGHISGASHTLQSIANGFVTEMGEKMNDVMNVTGENSIGKREKQGMGEGQNNVQGQHDGQGQHNGQGQQNGQGEQNGQSHQNKPGHHQGKGRNNGQGQYKRQQQENGQGEPNGQGEQKGQGGQNGQSQQSGNSQQKGPGQQNGQGEQNGESQQNKPGHQHGKGQNNRQGQHKRQQQDTEQGEQNGQGQQNVLGQQKGQVQHNGQGQGQQNGPGQQEGQQNGGEHHGNGGRKHGQGQRQTREQHLE